MKKNTIFLNALYLGMEIVNPSVRISAEHTTDFRRFYGGFAPNIRQHAFALQTSVGLFSFEIIKCIYSIQKHVFITFSLHLNYRNTYFILHITYYIRHVRSHLLILFYSFSAAAWLNSFCICSQSKRNIINLNSLK